MVQAYNLTKRNEKTLFLKRVFTLSWIKGNTWLSCNLFIYFYFGIKREIEIV